MATVPLHDVLVQIEEALGGQDEEGRAKLRLLEDRMTALAQAQLGASDATGGEGLKVQDLPKALESLQRRLDELERRAGALDPDAQRLVRGVAAGMVEPGANTRDD